MSNEVSANLGKFINDLDPVYMSSAMANACSLIQGKAKTKAPKDTGNLRRSIDFQVGADGTEGVIFSNAEYAPYVEVGTGIYSTRGGGRQTPWSYEGSHGWVTTRGNKPQPFLEPAANESRSDVINCFEGLI